MSMLKVSQLNNQALSHFCIGKFTDAERCLNRALLITDTMEEESDSEDYHHIDISQQEHRNQHTNQQHTNQQNAIFNTIDSQYNIEGMKVYYDPIFIQISSQSEAKMIQKAIIYNLGIGYMLLQQYDEAHAYFSKALSLKTVPYHNVSSLTSLEDATLHGPSDIMILHNLGYLSFMQGCYPEAFSYYSEALRLLQKFKGYYHLDVATCLNSIGIITMHSFMENGAVGNGGERAVGFFTEALAIYTAISDDRCRASDLFERVTSNIARIRALGDEAQEEDDCLEEDAFEFRPIESIRQSVDNVLGKVLESS